MRAGAVTTALVAIGVLTVLAVAGSGRLSGPTMLTLSGTHGVHLGDLLAVALGVVAVVAVLIAARR